MADLALTFGVSSYAAAVRVTQSDLLSKSDMSGVIGVIQSRGGAAESSGGNYYRTKSRGWAPRSSGSSSTVWTVGH